MTQVVLNNDRERKRKSNVLVSLYESNVRRKNDYSLLDVSKTINSEIQLSGMRLNLRSVTIKNRMNVGKDDHVSNQKKDCLNHHCDPVLKDDDSTSSVLTVLFDGEKLALDNSDPGPKDDDSTSSVITVLFDGCEETECFGDSEETT